MSGGSLPDERPTLEEDSDGEAGLDWMEHCKTLEARLAVAEATIERQREDLEQAFGLLWAVAVWFGNGEGQSSTYVRRDLGMLNAWVNKHELTDPDVGQERFQRAAAALFVGEEQ